jgi:outer membrane protein assembly factor BamA
VDLDGLDSTDLTLLSLSGAHEWRGLFNAPSLVLRTVPSVEASLSLGSTTPFIRPALQELLHGRFRTGMEYELRLAGGGLDRPVPDFELFTLGGANTVRGFKEDSRLGRGVASLQSELWIPFLKPLEGRPMRPEEIADPSKVRYEPRLARNVKFALFVDGGTVWQSPGIGRDTLYGVGVGIRFVVPGQPLVMRVDYGWGLGPNGGGSYPYFALGYHF